MQLSFGQNQTLNNSNMVFRFVLRINNCKPEAFKSDLTNLLHKIMVISSLLELKNEKLAFYGVQVHEQDVP